MSQSSNAPMGDAIMTSGAAKKQEEGKAMTGRSGSTILDVAFKAGMPPAPNEKEVNAAELELDMAMFPK